jgi:hypothetical protein
MYGFDWFVEEDRVCARCGRRSILVRRRINLPGRPYLCPACFKDGNAVHVHAYDPPAAVYA